MIRLLYYWLWFIFHIYSNTGLDFQDNSTIASLWILDDDSSTLINEAKGNLKSINEIARKFDEKIAMKVLNGNIHGLISISSDPDNTNEKTIISSIKMRIPIVGINKYLILIYNYYHILLLQRNWWYINKYY